MTINKVMTVRFIRGYLWLGVLIVTAIVQGVRHPNWSSGFLAGVVLCTVGFRIVERFMGSYPIYRRWYLMVRNELERIDPENKVLAQIGPRTSKREPWESKNG